METQLTAIEMVLNRRSIRRYEKKEIPKEILEKILEAGRQAPSAANRQPSHFIIISDEKLKRTLAQGRYNKFIKDAPITIIGCANIGAIPTRRWSIVDTTIALQNMVIAAWIMGIGSCWIGDFKEKQVKELLQIPHNWKIVALITFGYPAEHPTPRKKKPMDQIVSLNTFTHTKE